MSCLVAEKMWGIKGLRKSSFWIFQFCEGLSDFYVCFCTQWLEKTRRKALFVSLEKIKEGVCLLFTSLIAAASLFRKRKGKEKFKA